MGGRIPHHIATLAAMTALAIVPAACRKDEAARTTPAGPPQRIVCANTAAAEFACLLVGPERLAGLPEQIDAYGTFDAQHGGYENVARFFRYVAEPILVLGPDLVVTHEWQSADTTSILRSQGIDVLVLVSAREYEDIRRTLIELGARLGTADRAADVVQGLDARVEALRAGSGTRAQLTAMVYSNDGTGGATAGSKTTPDTMIRLAGLRNAAADAGLEGHVSIDFERLLDIDPDFLIVAAPARDDGGSPTKSVVESSTPLERLEVRKKPGRIVVLPAALMSADSPPLVDAAELIAREVDRALAAK